MAEYVTIVVKVPDNEAEKDQLNKGMKMIQPFQTAMSLEDEMTILEMIEQHEDFDPSIGDTAREQTAELHRRAELAAQQPLVN